MEDQLPISPQTNLPKSSAGLDIHSKYVIIGAGAVTIIAILTAFGMFYKANLGSKQGNGEQPRTSLELNQIKLPEEKIKCPSDVEVCRSGTIKEGSISASISKRTPVYAIFDGEAIGSIDDKFKRAAVSLVSPATRYVAYYYFYTLDKADTKDKVQVYKRPNFIVLKWQVKKGDILGYAEAGEQDKDKTVIFSISRMSENGKGIETLKLKREDFEI